MNLFPRLAPAVAAACLLTAQLAAFPTESVRAAGAHSGWNSRTAAPEMSAHIPTPPRLYYLTVEQQIAHWLHLSVSQVKRKLRTETDLFYVASDRHVHDVPDQVVAHEIAALQAAGNKMVGMHIWTPAQARQNMQTWRQTGAKLLTDTISSWFRRY